MHICSWALEGQLNLVHHRSQQFTYKKCTYIRYILITWWSIGLAQLSITLNTYNSHWNPKLFDTIIRQTFIFKPVALFRMLRYILQIRLQMRQRIFKIVTTQRTWTLCFQQHTHTNILPRIMDCRKGNYSTQIMAEVYLPHKVDQRQGRWSLNCIKRKFLSNHSWCHGIGPKPIYPFFFMPNLLPNSRMNLNFREQTICVYFHELTICFLAKYPTCLKNACCIVSYIKSNIITCLNVNCYIMICFLAIYCNMLE